MDKQKSGFVDFIPEGQEEGSPFGNGGFLDYVPAREVKETPEEVKETPKKKGSK